MAATNKLLKEGFYTRYAGGFFLIPYLLAIDIEEKIENLEIYREKGIFPLNAVLLTCYSAICGIPTLEKLNDINDYGLAVLAGLPIIPHATVLHRFLGDIKTRSADNFIRECSKTFVNIGLIQGNIVNIDGKFLGYFGQKHIGKDKHPTRNISMNGMKAYYSQDQITGDPIYLYVDHPGDTSTNIGKKVLGPTQDILGSERLRKAVFDRWFSVGELLNWINTELKIKYVTILKRYKNRIREMKSIPFSKLHDMTDSRKITFIHTNVRNYNGKVRLIVVRDVIDGEEVLNGFLTNDEDLKEENILCEYSKRWGIENHFKESSFLNIEKMPGVGINKVTSYLGIKMLAYNVLSCFRRDICENSSTMFIENIYNRFIDNQAFVQARGKTINVTFYRAKNENILSSLFNNLHDKLELQKIGDEIPWLGDKRLEFHFK